MSDILVNALPFSIIHSMSWFISYSMALVESMVDRSLLSILCFFASNEFCIIGRKIKQKSQLVLILVMTVVPQIVLLTEYTRGNSRMTVVPHLALFTEYAREYNSMAFSLYLVAF